MNNDFLYDFFRGFSRLFFIIPIGILITGLVIKFNQKLPQPPATIENHIISSTVLPNPKIINALSINLKGPFVCNFSSPEATISGFIKDGKAYGKIKKQKEYTNIVLNGDCFYFWNNASSQGEKICGLKPYIALAGNMSLGSLIGNNSSLLGSFLSKQSVLPATTDISGLLNSCEQGEIPDEVVFSPPTSVRFTIRANNLMK